ncbi:MAG: GerMN domain-containing protein [Candidatus Omnitrophica bacterium]|nr:GerMN domain-containing protein [Candidatus Omnitrophota bacterium]
MKRWERITVWALLGIFCGLVLMWFLLKQGWWILPIPTGVDVYFIQQTEDQSQLVAVKRSIRAKTLENRIQLAVQELIAGPTPAEKEGGFYSAVPSQTRLLNCRVEGETVFLDFSPDVDQGGGTKDMEERLGQIVFTATQFPAVKQVQLLINGEQPKYFGGEGITEVERPLTRRDFPQFYSGGKQ